jgi:hypothetical protein
MFMVDFDTNVLWSIYAGGRMDAWWAIALIDDGVSPRTVESHLPGGYCGRRLLAIKCEHEKIADGLRLCQYGHRRCIELILFPDPGGGAGLGFARSGLTWRQGASFRLPPASSPLAEV